jgi:hypothetical protein
MTGIAEQGSLVDMNDTGSTKVQTPKNKLSSLFYVSLVELVTYTNSIVMNLITRTVMRWKG